MSAIDIEGREWGEWQATTIVRPRVKAGKVIGHSREYYRITKPLKGKEPKIEWTWRDEPTQSDSQSPNNGDTTNTHS